MCIRNYRVRARSQPSVIIVIYLTIEWVMRVMEDFRNKRLKFVSIKITLIVMQKKDWSAKEVSLLVAYYFLDYVFVHCATSWIWEAKINIS